MIKKIFTVIALILVGIFSIGATIFSAYFLYISSDSYRLAEEKRTQKKNAEILLAKECGEDRYMENGECVEVKKTCPDGSVVSKSTVCNIGNISNIKRATTSPVSTSSRIFVVKPEDTSPRIKKITVTGGGNGKNMLVTILGTNFAKNNTVTLITGTGIEMILKLPAYPDPEGGQSMIFDITDFRTYSKGAYTFQVDVNGKKSNIYKVTE